MIQHVEKIDTYLEMIEKEGMDEAVKKDIKHLIEGFWKEETYSEKEILDFIFSIDFVIYSDLPIVEQIFKQAKILITPKDRKKGKEAYVQRMMKKYYKKSVQKTIQKAAHFMFRELINDCQKEITEEKINMYVEKMEFDIVYWCIASVIKDEKWKIYLKETYEKDYWNLYLQIIQRIHGLSNRRFLEESKEEVKTVDYEKETKRLQNELEKKEKELVRIRKELQQQIQIKNEKKEEIFDLKKMMKEQQELFEEERELYAETIIALSQPAVDFSEPIIEEEREKWTLNQQKIAVIGGHRERWYRETIEKYEGECVYVSVDDFNLIKGAISKSEVVFFLTEIVSHEYFRVAYRYAKKQNVPFVFINSKGVGMFERELMVYMKRKNEVL